MDKKIILGAIAVVAVIGLFLPFGSKTVVERVEEKLGAVASPDLPFNYISIGGAKLQTASSRSLIQATSSILCSLPSPASTSSLLYAGINISTATSAATVLTINRSTNQYATTAAALSQTTVASGVGGTLQNASGTQFLPNTYVNFGQTGGGVLNQTGVCEAIWAVAD